MIVWPRQSALQFSWPLRLLKLKLKWPEGEETVAVSMVSLGVVSEIARCGIGASIMQAVRLRVRSVALAVSIFRMSSSQVFCKRTARLQIIAIHESTIWMKIPKLFTLLEQSQLSDLQKNENTLKDNCEKPFG